MVLLLRLWSFICVNDIHLIIPVNMHLSTQRHCESMVISTLATYFQPSTWFIWYLHGQFSQFSCSVMSDSLHTHGLQHARLPCPSTNPGAYSNSCPLSQWCHPTLPSSVVPFSSCLQSFPASRSFPMSQLFASGGQSIGASSSTLVLSMNIQDWFPLGWTGWLSLQSKGLLRVFSNTTVQKYEFFSAQFSL